MSEWWTYTLSDLILFSSHAYYRLIELYNASVWPAHILALGLGVALVALARRGTASASRWVAGLLAACWLWVGIAFHMVRYATLNTAAPWFGWDFVLEAVLLLWIGVVRGRIGFGRPEGFAGRAGLALFVFALAAMPLAAPLFGRGWAAAQVFGLTPDPTAVGTLGLLFSARVRRRWLLMVLPTLWCATTGAILWALKSPDFWVAPLAAVLVVACVLATRQRTAK